MNPTINELVFSQSWEPGASLAGIQKKRMLHRALNGVPVGEKDLTEMIADHQLFLQQGGASGSWQTLLINGMVVAIYQEAMKTMSRQFSLEYRSLGTGLTLSGQVLPFSNCCAAWLPGLQAAGADFSYSIFTDVCLEKGNFSNAQLAGVDFSRADLREINFSGANLMDADFENCNLQGANFKRARIVGARFPGADLTGVLG